MKDVLLKNAETEKEEIKKTLLEECQEQDNENETDEVDEPVKKRRKINKDDIQQTKDAIYIIGKCAESGVDRFTRYTINGTTDSLVKDKLFVKAVFNVFGKRLQQFLEASDNMVIIFKTSSEVYKHLEEKKDNQKEKEKETTPPQPQNDDDYEDESEEDESEEENE